MNEQETFLLHQCNIQNTIIVYMKSNGDKDQEIQAYGHNIHIQHSTFVNLYIVVFAQEVISLWRYSHSPYYPGNLYELMRQRTVKT